METENKGKIPFLLLGGAVMAALLFFIVWGFNRGKPISVIIIYYFGVLTVFGIFAGIVSLIMWFLKPQRKDMVWIAKQRIIAACKSCRPLYKQELRFRGESELETRFIGFIHGICRIRSEELRYIEREEVTGTEHLEKSSDSKDMYLIAFKKGTGLIASILFPVEVVIGTKDDFTNLNMDTVYIKDICFAPKMYDLLVPAKHYKDTHLLDEPIKNLIYRYGLQENLVEFREIAADYLAISPQYQKARNMSKAQEFGIMNNNKTQPPQGN